MCADFEIKAGCYKPTDSEINLPDFKHRNQTNEGMILNYTFHLQKNGRTKSTCQTALTRLKRLSQLCNLNEPEQVKAVLADLTWRNTTKNTIAQIYNGFTKYHNITWQIPKYQDDLGLPHIPTEEELNTLISAGKRRTSTLLQLLKETGARIGEITETYWDDIDTQRKTIHIRAEKGSNPRILPISDQLINMLNNLPRTQNKIFTAKKKSLRTTFEYLRKREAKKHNNPRLLKIHFHTFRHWKATIEYHKTKDIIHVKTILGHKSIETTMKYINLEAMLYINTTDEWVSRVAHNINEDQALIHAGYEFVTKRGELNLYRKRK